MTRRELLERAEARLRARGGEEGAFEASRCFLRAMLMGLDDDAPVPDDLLARVREFLKIEDELLSGPPSRRASTRPPPASLGAPPGERRRRVLFLGRSDAARLAMIEAVARATLGEDVEIRAAQLAPVAIDPRAIRALRHAGYPTDAVIPRAVTVDDMSWADHVVTVSGEAEQWEKFLPRSTPHQHETIEDPVGLAKNLQGSPDEHDPFRGVLRTIERVVLAMRPPRSSRMPVAPVTKPSWSRMPALGPQRTPLFGSYEPRVEEEPPMSRPPSSGRMRTPK